MNHINKIKQYLVKLKNTSPIKIGNGDENKNILLIDNHAVITGTTLAGLFRSFILKDKEENAVVDKYVYPKDKSISKIYFYDSLSKKEITSEDLIFRHHVKIDEKYQTSYEEHLFSECHISSGQEFELRFEVRGLDIEEDEYIKLCNKLEEFIYFVSNEKITVGSKSTFGFGKLIATEENIYYSKEYNLKIEDDLNSYLEVPYIYQTNLNKQKMKIHESLTTNIIFRGYCEDGFIIKDEVEERTHKGERKKIDKSYKEKGAFLIPSSTIKGIIKSYAYKIYETLEIDKTSLYNIFGGKSDNEENIKGKLVFHDCKIKENNEAIYNRIKIDRFTGGVLSGAVFSQSLVTIPKENDIEFKVDIDTDDKRAIALIILAFRDIGLGYLTVGSGNNVGYGRFKGKSIIIQDKKHGNYELKFHQERLKGNIEYFNKIIKILYE